MTKIGYGKDKNNIIRGNKAQQQFKKACLAVGKKVQEPKTRYQSVIKHCDLKVDGKVVDVKSQKKQLYIELKEDFGNKGWWFCQNIQIFAFEFDTHFKIISRSELKKVIQQNMYSVRVSTKPNDYSECWVFPWSILENKVKYLYKVTN